MDTKTQAIMKTSTTGMGNWRSFIRLGWLALSFIVGMMGAGTAYAQSVSLTATITKATCPALNIN